MKNLKYLTLSALFLIQFGFTHDKGNWVLVWSDEFDGNGLPNESKWTYDVGGFGWGNKELQYYTDARIENAEVSNGTLKITAIREDFETNSYTSARLVTRSKCDFGYGRLEIRAKLPSAVGTWPAIWMMPQDWTFEDGGWPSVGEIDIMEHVGWEPGVIHASAHSEDYQWQKGTQKTATIRIPDATEAFHTYVLERDENVIRAYVDDQLYFEYKNEGLGVTKWPYNKPFYLILNIAVGGAWGSVEGIDETAFPQTMEVDFVRFYQEKAARDSG
ncbi:MAG: glycoside hydrolase family 16 protein [Opitutales bacterium]|nr:glycoside hydrolase family 16 protein [Opitutales bacterium]